MKKLLVGAALAVAAATSFAAAAPASMMNPVMSPWYVGVGLNYNAHLQEKVTAGGTSFNGVKSNGLGGNLFVGYQESQRTSTELGFNYLGQQKYVDDEKLNNNYNIHAVQNYGINITDWFGVYADAGVGYMTAKLNGTVVGQDDNGNPVVGNVQNSAFGFVYGAGAQFNINQFGIRASYTQLLPANKALDSVFSQDFLSLDVS